jgi:site-specific recombinase XerC
MRFHPEDARAVLPRVDPGRVRAGHAIGLRDGALLALIAAGLTSVEIAALHASAVTMVDSQVHVATQRRGLTWKAALPTDLGSWLLAWLSERRLWGEAVLVFTGRRGGPFSLVGISRVLHRYRTNPPARPKKKRKKEKKVAARTSPRRNLLFSSLSRFGGAR